MKERIHARGHENVTATHASTFEVTTDDYLTPAGDCILGIGADRAPADFDPAFVEACRSHDATVTITLRAAGETETITARGHPDLAFDSPRSAVVRTSDYVDDRTVAIRAGAAAADIDRGMVSALAGGADLSVDLEVTGAPSR